MDLLTVDGQLVLLDGKPIAAPADKASQEKSVTIAQNGTIDIVPDAGKVLSKATVTVAVPSDAKDEQAKSLTITKNGTTDIVPDSGKVLSKATVTVNVPSSSKEEQSKSVSITENGTTTIKPDTGKVLSSVDVTVNVPTSGGVTPGQPGDITFYDFDGTVVTSWSLTELASKSSLPTLPSHQGLVCQGWNWTLDDLKSNGRKADVGAYYITDDGTTRIYIHAVEGRTSPVLGCCPNGTVTIDWGDNTTKSTLTGTSTTSIKYASHTYDKPGDYVISLAVSGTFGLASSTTESKLLQASSASNARNAAYRNIVQKIELGSGISTIIDRAFNLCQGLLSITIPNTITNIGSNAFANCKSLSAIICPTSVTSIEAEGFYQSGIKVISLGSGMTSIADRSFYGCPTLYTLTMPNKISKASSRLADSNYSLAVVYLPANLTTVDSYAFNNCGCVSIYDFSGHTAVPTLSNTNAFTGISAGCKIRVPSTLVDAWKAATNWSTYANYIVGV